MNMPMDDDALGKVGYYRTIVLEYERLNDEIQRLLESHGGSTENLTSEQLQRYRTLARQRDGVMNEMRILEQQLLDE